MGKASRGKKKLGVSTYVAHDRRIIFGNSDSPVVDIAPMAPAAPTRPFNLEIKRGTQKRHIKKVYRFLNEETYADAFASGELRISTIETCRKYEDPLQGDAHEGTMLYRSRDYSKADWDTPGLREDALRAGIHIGPGVDGITMYGNTSHDRVQDALVLCTTVNFRPQDLSTFGKYCVEIHDVDEFFAVLTTALYQRYPIHKFYAGLVQYRNREFVGEAPPVHIGFIKPRHPYEPQQEFRMLWTVRTQKPLTAGNIVVPELSQFCRRIA